MRNSVSNQAEFAEFVRNSINTGAAGLYDVAVLGELIKSWRQDAGLKQEQLAKMVGSSRSKIQKIETNQYMPPRYAVREIAEALGKTLADVDAAAVAGGFSGGVVKAFALPTQDQIDALSEEDYNRLWDMVNAAAAKRSPGTHHTQILMGEREPGAPPTAPDRGGVGSAMK